MMSVLEYTISIVVNKQIIPNNVIHIKSNSTASIPSRQKRLTFEGHTNIFKKKWVTDLEIFSNKWSMAIHTLIYIIFLIFGYDNDDNKKTTLYDEGIYFLVDRLIITNITD